MHRPKQKQWRSRDGETFIIERAMTTTQPTIYIERGNACLCVSLTGHYTNHKGEDLLRFGNGFDDIEATIEEIDADDMPHTFAVGDVIELTHAELPKADEELMEARRREAREDY